MHLLVTSPRVATGLLTLEAWDLLRAASAVYAPDLSDPTAEAIVGAGIGIVGSPLPPRYESGAIWVAPTGDDAWAQRVAAEIDGAAHVQQAVSIVVGSYDLPGAKVLDLVEVMDRLRAECPWTAQQTHTSLSHYLLEETYETLEALDSGDADHLREELGDVLMQVVFHARIAAESEGWTIDEVAAGITEKLIYRNPHVFSDVVVADAAEVDANWQRLKASEKKRASPMEGIPSALPALALADKVLGRLDADVRISGRSIGDRLLVLVQEARSADVDAEEALRQAVRALLADPI
ncbi:nucleoside triphosphate pyrophosphohydrolase [soil metagenome]